MRITESTSALLLRGVDDEVDSVSLYLLDVGIEVWLPVFGYQARQRAAELHWERPVGEVEGAVFAYVQD